MRPAAPWCTQCWTDLRRAPPSAAPAAHAAVVAPGPAAGSPARPPPYAALGPRPGRTTQAGWPCGSCEAVNPVDVDVCTQCGAGFLSALRVGEPPLLVLPGVGDVLRLSRPQRLGLGAGVALALMLLVLVLGLLFV